ncbi:transglutaminase family protein [Paenibacillus sp. CMAA1364]
MNIRIQNIDVTKYNKLAIESVTIDSSVQRDGNNDTFLYRLLLTLPLMGLFISWLYPIQSITNQSLSTSLIQVLYILSALLLLTGTFRLTVWIAIPLQLILTMGTGMFFLQQESRLSGITSYGALLQDDVMAFVQGWSLTPVSAETRTLILIMGWGLLVSTVQSLAFDRRTVMLFGCATVLYLLSLEGFFEINVYAEIVRSVFLIIVLAGLLSLARHGDKASSSYALRNGRYVIWFISVGIVAAVAVSIAWVGGQIIQVRPADSLSIKALEASLDKWTGIAVNRVSPKSAVTGYGMSDNDMGVPLRMSDEIMFTVRSPRASYWRGESLGYYNGRRWSESQTNYQAVDMEAELRRDIPSARPKAEPMIQTIRFQSPMTQEFPLFSGGEVTRILNITTTSGDKQAYVLHDDKLGTVKYPATTGSGSIQGYQVEVVPPMSDVQSLRTISETDPDLITQHYLQLPDGFPERITELGTQITLNKDNRYDQVLEIQSFLQKDYAYSLDTKVPPANQDFVDHFLFTSKAGYCNHFSSAMIVLLRSQGIPSRLVKGYAPGELAKDSPNTYVVKALNAHSWVEVYFPTMGWIAFDPTPGFSMKDMSIQPNIVGDHDVQKDDIQPSLVKWYSNIMNIFMKNLQWIGIVLSEAGYRILAFLIVTILMMLTLLSIWRNRRAIYLWRLRYMTRDSFPAKEQLLKAAWVVWDEVARRLGPMPSGITLSEYITSLKDADLQEDLLSFVKEWESIAYGESLPNRTYSISFLEQCSQLAYSLHK